jgi:hypothetical protein
LETLTTLAGSIGIHHSIRRTLSAIGGITEITQLLTGKALSFIEKHANTAVFYAFSFNQFKAILAILTSIFSAAL